MQKCKIFKFVLYEHDITDVTEKKICEFLANKIKVISQSTAITYGNGCCICIITLFYEDPAPAGIVVRNSPAHIPPTEDPLANYKRHPLQDKNPNTPRECFSCDLGWHTCNGCEHYVDAAEEDISADNQ